MEHGFVAGASDRELDHHVDDPDPVTSGEAVRVEDRLELDGPIGDRGQIVPTGDIVVVELGVEPGDLSQPR
jgi:hypothetical protein